MDRASPPDRASPAKRDNFFLRLYVCRASPARRAKDWRVCGKISRESLKL